MPKGFHKHKILLDENMPDRSYFPNLNQNFDVKHVKLDFNMGSISDPEVYEVAAANNRIIITFNWPDFLNLVDKKDDAGIIGVGGLNWHRMDTKLTSLLMKHKPPYFSGRIRTLGQEETRNTS